MKVKIEFDLTDVRRMFNEGYSRKEIAEKYKCTTETVNRYLRDNGLVEVKLRHSRTMPLTEPETFTMAPKKIINTPKVVINGHRYIDITDLITGDEIDV